jgi:hypothetical protein
MSFVDLMGNDVWTEADILNRTEAMVREHVSATEETILNRKVSAAGMGIYQLTAEDRAAIGAFAQATHAAQLAGIEARADMALLSGAMAVETAYARLLIPAVDVTVTDAEGNEVPNPVKDQAERVAAQAVIDGATQPVLDLVETRVG